jgi:hypothetical protein
MRRLNLRSRSLGAATETVWEQLAEKEKVEDERGPRHSCNSLGFSASVAERRHFFVLCGDFDRFQHRRHRINGSA